MAIRLPRGFIRGLVRITLKPFIRPPFAFGFQRLWVRLAAILSRVDGRAARAKIEVEGMPTLRAQPGRRDPETTVLYLHGGGYCWGSWGTHASLITHLAIAADTVVYAPNYRLAPEHPHPAGLEDALAAYEWLLAQGVSPGALTIAGDSAGGGLTLALALAIRDRGLPMPASIVLISPWVDMRGDSRSMREKASVDPMLSPSGIHRCSAAYCGGRDPDDPGCSPLFADLVALPPMLIQVGTDEILLDDSTRLAERCREAGVDVTLKVFEGLWHDFQIHVGMMKESDEAIGEIAEFLRLHFTGAGAGAGAGAGTD
jgi:acetyl esterase/lipase